jgi:hypothetical protein
VPNRALRHPERAIAIAIGVDPGQDQFPAVLAAAVMGATRAAMAFWVASDSDIALESAVREALAFLAPMSDSRRSSESRRREKAGAVDAC